MAGVAGCLAGPGAAMTVPPLGPQPRRLHIERKMHVIDLKITCATIYDAMQMEDQLLAAAKAGRVQLTLTLADPGADATPRSGS